MSEFEIRVARAADAPALADLANQHTYPQLSETARQGGFLTGAFTVPALQAMLASAPGLVAHYGQELAGFVINSCLAPARYPPLVQQISSLLPSLSYQDLPLVQYRWFFYGPVLVTPAYRGRGLLRQLFEASQQALAGRFDLGIAFIAAENTASLRLHTHKLGLVRVGGLVFEGAAYAILVFPVG